MTHPSHPRPTPVVTEEQRRKDAVQYVYQLRVLYSHAAVFASSMVIIFVVNLAVNLAAGLTGYWWAWWSGWALLGWGVGIAIHGMVVRIQRPKTLGASWEERRVDELLSS